MVKRHISLDDERLRRCAPRERPQARAVESPEQPKAPPAPRWRLRRSVDGVDGTRAARKALLTVSTPPAYAAGAHAADQLREQVPPPPAASLALYAACVTLLKVTGSHSAKGSSYSTFITLRYL